ncbi:hypothetical protein GCM10022237_30730 [Nocardioides ginsengisoli]|uniref:Glycerophosphoryl diester phosphodiesterase membrane domain-containing protein n=1 Tax=Nocardioides ginsengisoli TaxID=363868 RepID=A0ABW3VX48_9ACTN
MTDGPAHPFPPPGAPVPDEPVRTPYDGAPPPPSAPPATPYPAPGYAPYPSAPGPRPGMFLGAAHKPGALPLRPLTLGAMYDGAFRIIRFNPKATVGAAFLVTGLAMLLPIVVTAVLTFTVGLTYDTSGELGSDVSTSDALALLAAYGSLLVSILLAQLGVVFVTGMIAHVTRAAAVGRRLGLGEAWAATRGKRWRLLGLSVLLNVGFLLLLSIYGCVSVVVVVVFNSVAPIVLWFVFTLPALLALCCWLWIRVYYLPVPALMLEPIGLFAAIGRGWSLTSRQFWRTFGIGLLTVIAAGFAGNLISAPISVIGNVGIALAPAYGALLLVLTQALALLVQTAFVTPFQATVASVQYVDLRMRKEAFDVELMREAGIIPS